MHTHAITPGLFSPEEVLAAEASGSTSLTLPTAGSEISPDVSGEEEKSSEKAVLSGMELTAEETVRRCLRELGEDGLEGAEDELGGGKDETFPCVGSAECTSSLDNALLDASLDASLDAGSAKAFTDV